jgi:Cu(I)/Ag(I) efflux system membrane protein CusA/SilA
MIAAVIRWSLRNRLLVLLATLIMAAWGVWSVQQAPLDALPDLSDTQVIIRVSYPGKAPQIVEDQVTYPLTTTMLSVPGRKPCAAFRCSAMLMSMCCLMMERTRTGRAPACWST